MSIGLITVGDNNSLDNANTAASVATITNVENNMKIIFRKDGEKSSNN